jgi:hypothetical protein
MSKVSTPSKGNGGNKKNTIAKQPADIMNVDYDDVLNLYRGWKKSETNLKDKNRELNELKERTKKLAESHSKFRSQIQALSTLKEITVNLQTDLSICREDNESLKLENRNLHELNSSAEELLKERIYVENDQKQVLSNLTKNFELLTLKYEKCAEEQKKFEARAADELTLRQSVENRLHATEEILYKVRNESKTLKLNLDTTSLRTSQCDNELANASEQISNMGKEIASLNITKEKYESSQSEIGVLKGDISRLLRLIETYPATKGFLVRWQTSEGMSFIGTKSSQELSNIANINNKPSIKIPKVDESDDGIEGDNYPLPNNVDEDYDNEEIDDEIWENFDLTASKLTDLTKKYNGDVFPMTSSFKEESQLWIPREAGKAAMRFHSSKIPHAPPSVILDFLRKMNKVWLRREKRKIDHVKEEYNSKMADLRRQIIHAKPYNGVIQGKKIQRLENAIQQEKTKNYSKIVVKKSKQNFEEEDDEDTDLPPHHRRLCMKTNNISDNKDQFRKSSVQTVSTEKLLEASLQSLETIGRQTKLSSSTSNLNGLKKNESYQAITRNSKNGKFTGPSEEYLRGALWLGRNLTMLTEELADTIDNFRAKHTTEVEHAKSDTDIARSCHRLNLLAGTGLTETLSLVSLTRVRAREILQVFNYFLIINI